MNVQNRILFRASELFKKYGVKNVSMDEIAGELGISKKTIYLYYQNKAKLVEAFVGSFCNKERTLADQIQQEAENAVHELILTVRQMNAAFVEISPRLIYEVKKYYPLAWRTFETFKLEYMQPLVTQNLQKGISEGYYRKDIHVDIVGRMRVAQMEMGFQHELYPYKSYDPKEVQLELFRMYMYGIVTEKGRGVLARYLQTHPEVQQFIQFDTTIENP